MENVFFKNKKVIPYYVGLWVVFSTVLVVLQVFITDWPLWIILSDTIVSLLLLFVFLLPTGYIVKHTVNNSNGGFKYLLTPVAAGLVMVLAWVLATVFLIENFSIFPENYVEFSSYTWLLRASVGFLLALAVFFMILAFQLTENSIEAIERESYLVNLLQKTELQALKNQLNPHFIYNSLNSINSLTISSPEKAREMVSRLSNFLRYALRQDAMQMTTLQNELENIESYLNIEIIRFGERLTYTFSCPEEFQLQEVPVMILQPLFENAVKHGVQKSNLAVEVLFEVIASDNSITLMVTNNFDEKYSRFRSEGVGLENIRNRLRLLYGNGQLLSVGAEKELFKASITLPKKNHTGITDKA